jgi:HSP20 family protein
MAIMRWTPFGALGSLEREVQDLFDRFTTRRGDSRLVPATDVYRANDTLVVRTELPGVDPSGIDVEVEGSILHIRGEKLDEREIDEPDRYVYECRYGRFERDIPLPQGVDAETVEASLEHGVLTVRVGLPASAAAAPRKVAVEVTKES